MLDHEYERLIICIKGMISDGVGLIHGGHLIDWEETSVLDILAEIERKKKEIEMIDLEIGDLLQNRYTGQKATIINIDKINVHLVAVERVIVFPIEKILYHYQKSKPGE